MDDLVTTGATLAEGARALGEAGADVLVAAVVAATAKHGPGGPAQALLPQAQADRPQPG